MSKLITKILITAVAALIASWLLKGVNIDNSITAILVAVVLGLLNTFIRPIFIILTIPITIVTLGLFLIVINIIIIKWVATLVPGFSVTNWWAALWFSIIVSIISSVLGNMAGLNEKKDR